MSNFIKENWFKLLGVILLVIGIADHPYSYYQILRWSIMIIAGYSAYLSNKKDDEVWFWIFAILAILFNPIIPFYFSKDTWQIIDLATAVILFVNVIGFKKLQK